MQIVTCVRSKLLYRVWSRYLDRGVISYKHLENELASNGGSEREDAPFLFLKRVMQPDSFRVGHKRSSKDSYLTKTRSRSVAGFVVNISLKNQVR